MLQFTGSVAPRRPSSGHGIISDRTAFWQEHDLSEWNVIYCVDGSLHLQWSHTVSRMAQGDLILIPPHKTRSYRITTRCEFYWLHLCTSQSARFQQSGVTCFSLPSVRQRHVEGPQRSRITATFGELCRLNLQPQLQGSDHLMITNLADYVVLQCLISPAEHAPRVDVRAHQARDLLHNQSNTDWTIATLAHAVGLSRSRLAALFRREYGSGPMTYLERLRLERASQLLTATSMPIKDVSEAVGFHNAYHFSTRFKNTYGHSPRDWRAMKSTV